MDATENPKDNTGVTSLLYFTHLQPGAQGWNLPFLPHQNPLHVAHTGNSMTTALLSRIKIANQSARKEVQFNDEMPTEQETTTGSGSNATTDILHQKTEVPDQNPPAPHRTGL